MNSDHSGYGFLSFRGYSENISPDARSVGISTQPYDGDTPQSRLIDFDPKILDRCRIVVTSFKDYLEERFPNARISIHNNANESVALAYTRMIMANQTIVGTSSFGVFPAIATLGTGYLRRPDFSHFPKYWVLDPAVDDLTSNVILFDQPILMCHDVRQLWLSQGAKGVLAWFWNETTHDV